jgi:hypothetical protein
MAAEPQQWAVTKLEHPAVRDWREVCAVCVRQVEPAITYARVTGSVGSTYSTQDPDGMVHSATVARAIFVVES